MVLQINKLKRLREALKVSKTFDQSRYRNVCGTPACIAGHAVFLFKDLPPDYNYSDAHEDAQKVLGLSGKQADELFEGDPYWDQDDDNYASVDEAVGALDTLIHTGKVEWPPRGG